MKKITLILYKERKTHRSFRRWDVSDTGFSMAEINLA